MLLILRKNIDESFDFYHSRFDLSKEVKKSLQLTAPKDLTYNDFMDMLTNISTKWHVDTKEEIRLLGLEVGDIESLTI